MKKIINDPDFVVEDLIQGYLKAHPNVELSKTNGRVIVQKKRQAATVSLVSGGGSGHEPAFLGYTHKGILDAVAIGEVFTSPPATSFLDAFVNADTGQGVVCMIGNYAGDRMNVAQAIETAKTQGIEVYLSIANDDIASQNQKNQEKRHGIAAGPLMWSIARIAADLNQDGQSIVDLLDHAMHHCRSITVGLTPGTIPALGKPNYTIPENAMSIGLGHHGEPGLVTTELSDAQTIAEMMLVPIVEELALKEEDEILVVVSGMGATPLMEQYILFNEVERYCTQKKIVINKAFVDNYVTSLDMQGCGLSVLKLDPKLKSYTDLIKTL